MSNIIDHFKTITQIPHCSEAAGELYEFLIDFASTHGYTVETDDVQNILAYRGTPTLCLQAHYDMVCMGTAPQIETVEEEGWMRAVSSSLGADNGVAIAMMMALMEEGAELEFLFTADEEIGLIGAGGLALELRSTRMLNLDSEEEAEVTIGCAGGADITGEVSGEQMPGTGVCYEVAVRGLPGGHSGVDIDRGTPSAIKVLFDCLHEQGVEQVASVIAGQRRNAIPSDAIVIVRSELPLSSTDTVEIRPLEEQPDVYVQSQALIEWVHGFEHGVRSHNESMGIPQTSINLALINDRTEPQGLTIETSARAMSMEDLEVLVKQTVAGMKASGFAVQTGDKYPAWSPEENAFTRTVSEAMEAEFGHVAVSAIHAGLECGILSQRFPHIEFASIGPTIHYPHSTREEVDLASVERIYEVVKRIVDEA